MADNVFQYKGRDQEGQMITGKMAAESASQLAQRLSKMNITPIKIDVVQERLTVEQLFANGLPWQSVDNESLVLFARQMHALISAGVPIIQSLQSLGTSLNNPKLKSAILELIVGLESGLTLSQCMAQHRKVFPELMVTLVQVGESSGKLEDCFMHIAEYLVFEENTKKQIKSATRYPSMVMIALVVALFIMNIYVIPAFKGFFASFGADLPLITRILITVSDFMINHLVSIILAVSLSVAGFMYWINQYHGKRWWGRLKLRLPVIGKIIEQAQLARFSKAFALAISAGVPLLQALNVISGTVNNAFLSDKILAMKAGLEHGESLTRIITREKLFTNLVRQMIMIGEETGKLDEMLRHVADVYERDVEYDVKRLGDNIEPILISVIAGMVLLLALGIFLPMWDLSSVAFKG